MLMNRLIGIASAIVLVLLLGVPAALAAGPGPRGEHVVIVSGADVTLAADQSVELLIVYNGTARVEGEASSIIVVNGTADLVGARAHSIIAIQGRVSVDAGTIVSGAIRTIESDVSGATAATVVDGVRTFGPDLLLGWRDVAGVLLLVSLAFAVSALVAGVILAGLAGRQVRAAGALITNEPVMVLVAGIAGVIGLVTAGIVAIVTVVGIPFGVGLLAVVMPVLFVIGYIVAGTWLGELVLRQSSPVVRQRPYLAAVVGLTVVGLVSLVPPVGGLISFVGFGAVMLLSWRVIRLRPGQVPASRGAEGLARVAG
jgi:hypothetical protein